MTQNTMIAIDSEVQDFLIKKKKKTLVLDISISGGGCCPTYEVADISYKKPENISLYNVSITDDIEVYISKMAIVSAPVLRFSLENGFVKQIVAKGLNLKK